MSSVGSFGSDTESNKAPSEANNANNNTYLEVEKSGNNTSSEVERPSNNTSVSRGSPMDFVVDQMAQDPVDPTDPD